MSRPISPGLRSGSLPLLATLMTLLASLSLSGLTGVKILAANWNGATQNTATIEVPADTPQSRTSAEHLRAVLAETPGLTNVQLLSEAKVRKLLAPWLGNLPDPTAFDASPLLLPAVLTVHHDPTVALAPLVHRICPAAIVEEDLRWSQRLQTLGDSLVACAWLSVILVVAVAVLSTAMTVRRSIVIQHRTIEIVHFLGGTYSQLAARIAYHAAILTLLGSMIGLLLFMPLLLTLTRLLSPLLDQSTNTGGQWIANWEALLNTLPVGLVENLAAIPACAALLAWLTAQTVVRLWLRRLP